MRAGPFYRVLNNSAAILIKIGCIGFVPGLEVENFSITAGPGAAAAQNIPYFKPAQENYIVRPVSYTHLDVYKRQAKR